MKNNFTFKQLLLFVAFILLGINGHLKAQVTLIKPNATEVTYATIQLAYDAINFTANPGAHTIRIESGYTGEASYPLTLGLLTGASVSNTVTIRPKDGVNVTLSYPNQTVVATGVTCNSGITSLPLTLATLSNDLSVLSTSSYVAGQGTPNNPFKQLAGVNVSTKTLTLSAGTITSARNSATLFFGPQQTKTINFDGAKYVTIDGVSRTGGSTGLTISNPNCIYSQTIYFMNNAQYNTIKNCIIRGANTTSTNTAGGLGGTIYFNTTDHNLITQNDVCDMNDGITPMPIAAFQVTASGNNTYNTISENNIYNIENLWASASVNCGFIQCGSGGASGYNNILNNKMYWTRTPNFGSGSTVVGIGTGGSMSAPGNRFEGNTIGYSNANGTGTATINGPGATFRAVNAFRNFTCKNNIISNIDFTGVNFTGIDFGSSSASTASDDACNGNIVQNIKLTHSAGGTLSGITVNVANGYDSNIKNNIVRDLTAESANASTVCTVIGLNVTGGTPATKIYNYSGNQVYNLTAGKSTSTAANVAYGIRTGLNNAVTVEKNLVYNIEALNNSSTAIVYGLNTNNPGYELWKSGISYAKDALVYYGSNVYKTAAAGTSGSSAPVHASGSATDGTISWAWQSTVTNAHTTTFKNNVIRLGISTTNTNSLIYGIYQNSQYNTNGVNKLYNNSVYIGGTAPASASQNSFAFYSDGSVVPTTNELKNNIFANQRINESGTAAKHYAIGYATGNVIKICDYNLYWASPVGLAAGVDKTLLSNWQGTVVSGSDAASYASDPLLVDPTNTTTPNLRLNSASSNANVNGFNLAATVADDYLGYNRADFTPHDMGAYAYADNTSYPTLDVATAVTAITTTTASSGGNVTLDGGSAITARGVCWNAAAIPTVSNNPTSDGSTTGSFTSSITNLTPNTVYNLRSYATNSTGTAYSPNITFTTLPGIPTSPNTTSPTTATTFKANWTAPAGQGSATFTYTLEYSTVPDLSSGVNMVAAVTSTNSTPSGLTPSTTYYYRVKAVNASGSGGYSSIQSGTTIAATVVNVTTAQNASALTLNANTILNIQNGGILTIDNSPTVYALNIYGGGAVTLNDTKTLTVTGNFTIKSDPTYGTGTFIDLIATSGSLTVNGTRSVEQYLTTGRNWYVSSPVASAASSVFSAVNSNTNKLYYYNEPTGTATPWIQITDNYTSLAVMRGYISNNPTDGVITFTGGALNTGSITTGLNGVASITRNAGQTKEGFNLLGNPYPSYLNVTTAINGNANMEKTVWYRTRETSSPNNYYFETVNTTSGVGTNLANTGTVTGYIPPMQGFWVRATASTSLTFNNTMRSHATNVTTDGGPVPTTRLKAPKANATAASLIRFQVSNGLGKDEAILYLNENASNGFDNYDSPKMSNGNVAIPEIFTTAGSEQLVINGLNSIPLDQEIPLGFKTGTANTFSIKATELRNFAADTKIVLKDKVDHTEQELTLDVPYSFNSGVVNDANRFSLIFKSAGVTTGIYSADYAAGIQVFKNANSQITINCPLAVVGNATVSVYNAVGQKLDSSLLNATTTVLPKHFTAGVYFVSVLVNGNVDTRKVVIN